MGKTRIGMQQLAMLEKIGKKMIDMAVIDNWKKKSRTNKSLIRLEEVGLISFSGEKVKITEKGEKMLGSAEKVVVTKPAKWDKIWRIVVYDIPNELNVERRQFRLKLKEMGFVMIQKSVWALPYDCKEEIAILSHTFRLTPFVIYLTTERLPNETKLKDFFELT